MRYLSTLRAQGIGYVDSSYRAAKPIEERSAGATHDDGYSQYFKHYT
jgi:hypothetical protein